MTDLGPELRRLLARRAESVAVSDEVPPEVSRRVRRRRRATRAGVATACLAVVVGGLAALRPALNPSGPTEIAVIPGSPAGSVVTAPPLPSRSELPLTSPELPQTPGVGSITPPVPSPVVEVPDPLPDGSAWEAFLRPPGFVYINDVSFPDADHGWVVGGPVSLIAATADGGETWQGQPSGVPSTLLGVSFVDRSFGWIVGYNGTILATVDGGGTWTRQTSPGGNYFAVSFVDRTHGWAAGNCGVIAATIDGGVTWVSQGATPGQESCPGIDITDITFADRLHGWAVSDGQVQTTSDGGRTWTSRTILGGRLRAAFLASPTVGWVVGRDLILSSDDGGVTWAAAEPGVSNVTLFGVAFADLHRGWAVGIEIRDGTEYGIVLATTDGGLHWNPEVSGTPSHLRALSVADGARVHAVGRAVLRRRG